MAGYNVTTPPLFKVRDPQELVDFNLNTLNSQFVFRDGTTVVSDSGSVTYTADAILKGYIVRQGSGEVYDQLDTASNILDAMYRKLLAIGNNDILPNGSTVNFTLYIDQGPIGLEGNTGVTINWGNYIDGGCVAKVTLMVIDQARLNTPTDQSHSDRIAACLCGGYGYIAPGLAGISINKKQPNVTFVRKP